MTVDTPFIRIGTRASALARWQTDYVSRLLRARSPDASIEIVVISTRGDRVLDTPLPLVGGKGLFTAEIEGSLRNGQIDLAVHSLKDLPTESAPGLTTGAIPCRTNPADVIVSRNGYTLKTLPEGATVGTSSLRRSTQILNVRSDLRLADIRGNVDTRIEKAMSTDEPYDAVILARAGLERLGLLEHVSAEIPTEILMPAPGQGALAVQCRDEPAWIKLCTPLNYLAAEIAVTAERAFLADLGGGCSVPISALATCGDKDATLHLCGRVSSSRAAQTITVQDKADLTGLRDADVAAAVRLGASLARKALDAGASSNIMEQMP